MRTSRTLFRLLSVVPAPIGSWLGACAAVVAPRLLPQRHARAMRNLALLQPDLSRTARDRLLRRRWRNMGRFLFEYAALGRLSRSPRIRIDDPAGWNAMLASARPLILVSIHIGNWELLFAHLFAAAQRDWRCVYLPPVDRQQAHILAAARGDYAGASIAPGDGAAVHLRQHLRQANAGLYVLLDGVANRQVTVPTFGRGFARRDNLSVVLRLAAITDALIVPVYLTRSGGCRFRLGWRAPLDPDATGAAAVAKSLDTWFEQLAIEHVDQWLSLHDLRLRAPTPSQ